MLRNVGLFVSLLTSTATGAVESPRAVEAAGVVDLLRTQDDALLRIGERLAVAGRPFCAGSSYASGMTVQLLAQYGAAYRAAAAAALNVGDVPTVTSLAPGGAATAAGLQVGDRIVAIDGHRFAPVAAGGAGGAFGPTSAALDAIERELADGTARLTVERAGAQIAITLVPRPACRVRFDVRAGRSSNASADGTYVQVSSDLVADTRGDTELAAVLAHELAHNILRHPQRLKGPRPRPSVRQTEVEADRLSVYLLDAAGFGAAGAQAFWARWGRAHDWGIFAAGTHPGWKERVRIVTVEAARIAARRAAGQPVTAPPDLDPRT